MSEVLNNDKLIIIWLDANIDPKLERDLHCAVSVLKVFQDPDQCVDHIISFENGENVLLIVSGSYGRNIVPLIYQISQLVWIYIYCINKQVNEQWAKNYEKIHGVFTEKQELLAKLNKDIYVYTRNVEQITSSVCTNLGNSTRPLTEEKVTFMWFQLLIEILLLTPQLPIALDEMLNICSRDYIDNHAEQTNITEFKQALIPEKAVWWYTRDTFLYKLLNKALRTQNIDDIFRFRYFIVHLHNQLTQLHRDYIKSFADKSKELICYRGQQITSNELERLKKDLGSLISMNGFLSTTTSFHVAKEFALKNISSNTKPILFHIHIDLTVPTSTPFANISQWSAFKAEDEVLFSLGAVFRLDLIKQEGNLLHIHLKMGTVEMDPQVKALLDYTRQEICSTRMTFSTYGKFLALMSEFDSSIKYFKQLLIQLPNNHPDLATINNDMAYAYRESHQFNEALEYYNEAIRRRELQTRMSSNDHNLDLAQSYGEVGWLHM
ncbi:unnamed protein product, partial [Didymodactylos carnosus]